MKTEGTVTINKVALTPDAIDLLEYLQMLDLRIITDNLEDISDIIVEENEEIGISKLTAYLRTLSFFRKLARSVIVEED